MSTALLKFQELGRQPLDAAILAAALDASPEPMSIAENGKLIYANRSFAQLSTVLREPQGSRTTNWHSTEFAAAGRSFVLTTVRHDSPVHSQESEHVTIIGRLVGGVAHDFNNLLTGILLYCDLLQTKLDTQNPLWRKVEEIRIAAGHGADLIRQLMTLGREELSAPRKVLFNYVVRELEPLLRHLLGEHIRIVTDLVADRGQVGISVAQAQQIVLNLSLNARDAMTRGGTLRFETRFREFEGTGRGDRIFEFAVTDTGDGMDEQIASRIFDPFFTTKLHGCGTGMGLATVRRIVEDAGGIVCLDTAPGKGTRMMVRLPEIESTTNKAVSLDRLSAPKNQALKPEVLPYDGCNRSQ